MKRIIIIGEGPTEQEFCQDVLQPFFFKHEISIENPTIKKSSGGIVSWNALKNQISNHLQQDKTALVSTLIDYYGIHPNHSFPHWESACAIVDKQKRMDFLEQAMLDDIDDSIRYRFIPYIQLHEFEGLLFSDIDIILNNFGEHEFTDHPYLLQTSTDFANPEAINDGAKTAPSKRLDRILDNYSKVVYGSLLAQEIGLNKIREKCPRFNAWIDRLLI